MFSTVAMLMRSDLICAFHSKVGGDNIIKLIKERYNCNFNFKNRCSKKRCFLLHLLFGVTFVGEGAHASFVHAPVFLFAGGGGGGGGRPPFPDFGTI